MGQNLHMNNQNVNDLLDLPLSEFDILPSERDVIYGSDKDSECTPSDCSKSEDNFFMRISDAFEDSEQASKGLNEKQCNIADDPGERTSTQQTRPNNSNDQLKQPFTADVPDKPKNSSKANHVDELVLSLKSTYSQAKTKWNFPMEGSIDESMAKS
ncbi:hypothetical protein J6590_026657 [Homalodisca vitripennis]|nr:hypothetical protein J6590_026657 [Homalodisca vitripennis]